MLKKWRKTKRKYHLYSLSFFIFVALTFASLIVPTTTIHALSAARASKNKQPCLDMMHCHSESMPSDRQTRSEEIEAVLTIDTIPTGATARVVVPVTASLSERKLYAATVAVNYDPALLRPVSCEENPDKHFSMALCNIQFDIDGVNPDTIRFTAVSVDGVSGDAKLVALNFEVIGEVSENTALGMRTLAFADDAGAALPVTIQNNEIADIVPNMLIFLPIITRE